MDKYEIKFRAKNFYAFLGGFGAVCSIVSVLITQAVMQSSSGDYSPNIYGEKDINVEINTASKSESWFEKHENNKPNITKEQFDQLVPGLTYDQVVDILKIEGTLTSKSASGLHYAWGKSPFFYLYATFDGAGKLSYAVNNGLF